LILEKDIEEIKKKYPELKIYPKNDEIVLKGLLDIYDRNGNYIDSFNVEIFVPKSFPKSLPIVKEIGDDIPKNPDRHVNPDGTLCLTLPVIMKEKLKKNPSVVFYIEKFVKPYLAIQIYFEKTGKWLTGEYNHGEKGVIEFISELFNLDIGIATKLYYYSKINMKKVAIINWNSLCPCGSGRVLKKCHKKQILKILKLLYGT